VDAILVVGDWMIDDYWITGTHRARTASRVGRWHYRALNSPNASVQELAGAGRVASLLHSTAKYDIHGLGMWQPEDTEHLAVMFIRDNTRGWTPCRINRSLAAQPENVRLHSLASFLAVGDCAGTTRVVRLNRLTGTRVDLLGRIDWDAIPPDQEEGMKVWITPSNALRLEGGGGLRDDVDGAKLPRDVSHIVVKDMRKGVVSKALIERLVTLYPRADWFVSSKKFAPPYLKSIPEGRLRLYLIPEMAALDAGENAKMTHWFCRAGKPPDPKPTREALQTFQSLFKEPDGVLQKQEQTLVVALPEELRLLARSKQGMGFVQGKLGLAPYFGDAAFGSAFFPALVHELVSSPLSKEALSSALQFAAAYNQMEHDWIASLGQGGPPPTLGQTVTHGTPALGVKEWDWNGEEREWDQAMAKPGLVGNPDQGWRLQLWRATTEVAGYVCCVPSRRKALAILMKNLHAFKHNQQGRNMSGMLIAKPGSGKTSLVRSLASASDMQMLDFNITQMIARRDVFAAFDTIITTQAQNREKPMIVFFDEINAKVENQYVYEMFLAPLQDGVYLRDGKKHAISPCVWLFAGTARPTENVEAADSSAKVNDFESRLTLPVVELRSEGALGERIESVYRGVAMLRHLYPDVGQVSARFLEFLFQLRPTVTPREVHHILESLEEVQHGQVSMQNLPPPIREMYYTTQFGEDPQLNDETWVDIE
jgi:hypothetical protein